MTPSQVHLALDPGTELLFNLGHFLVRAPSLQDLGAELQISMKEHAGNCVRSFNILQDVHQVTLS